jgi:hypothetical protein
VAGGVSLADRVGDSAPGPAEVNAGVPAGVNVNDNAPVDSGVGVKVLVVVAVSVRRATGGGVGAGRILTALNTRKTTKAHNRRSAINRPVQMIQSS